MPARDAARVVEIGAVPAEPWAGLAARAVEPNAFYDPAWVEALTAHVAAYRDAQALLAFDTAGRLAGFLPFIRGSQAFKLPLPLIAAWQPYAPLMTPLLDRDAATGGATGLIAAAQATNVRALLLRETPLEGEAAKTLRSGFTQLGITPFVVRRYARARLDARQNADAVLHAALGSRKLKEIRRQRKRLAESGAMEFSVAQGDAVPAALEQFLALEAAGWKGRHGTALATADGESAFVRAAAARLAPARRFEVATLNCAGKPVAAALILRQGRRAFFFKIAFDETRAKASPGVQLTLDLTRHFCADPEIDEVDSLATANHPMIGRIWNGRIEIGDLLFALHTSDPGVAAMAGMLRFGLKLRETAAAFVRRIRG